MSVTSMDPSSVEHLRDAVGAICAVHSVARLEVFGSRAAGTAHAGSDVDLLVEFLPESNAGLFEMGALQDALQERLGCRVDLLSRRAVEQSRNPYRRRAILAHPETLYAR
jgi:uncharacterized protein